MFSSKKPKFKLDFTVKEVSNIPHTTGYCYVDVLVQDGHAGIRAALSLLRPVKDDSSNTETKLSTSGHVHVRTSKRKINNFRCLFNYNVSCNLRFPVKKKENMIAEKYLLLKVYYMGEKSSKFEGGHELGRVELNLAEYLNFSLPVTTKFLLQDSKVNSIVSFSVGLTELPSDFEFLTQLQIKDSPHHHSSTSKLLDQQSLQKESTFNIPQFQNKAVIGGIDGGLNSKSSQDSTGHSAEDELSKKEHKEPQSDQKETQPRQTYDNIIMDPIVSGLYRNVLESAWDPQMVELLKYPPEKVVEHIFSCGPDDDWREGLPAYEDIHKLLLSTKSDERDSSGLVGEEAFRDDLKSWSISWV